MNQTGISAPATVRSMRARAGEFLASLGPVSRRRATVDIADREERARWFYTPNPRRGLALNQMRPRQQQLALQLLASGLSEGGFTLANYSMSLENLLDRRESWGQRRGRLGGRDPQRYAVAIFGDPTAEVWSWRFEGHHLSIRYTVAGDLVSCTPLFMGLHPARPALPNGAALVTPMLPITLAVELLEGLPADQRAEAIIAPIAPIDIVTSNRAVAAAGDEPRTASEMIDGVLRPDWARWRDDLRAELGSTSEADHALRLPVEPDGVAGGVLDAEPLDRLQQLTDYYTGLVPDEVASGYRGVIASGERPSFAWAGPVDAEQATYFRIRSERLLIEVNNTQDHANHVHAVWRDPAGDFGRDLLGEPLTEVPWQKRPLPERVAGRLGRFFD